MKAINNLSLVRKRKGLTVQDLGEKLNYSYSLIIEIEEKGHIPSVYQALKIAQALDVEVTELFNVTDW
ncbi:MAG: helix-turn-helix transcriptional regulator [Bacteroidales bacterium]|nr:helix-turn-helix transcriptional regulator [Bacteroidales bacterium]